MKKNEYDPAEAVEIGNAEDIILGQKMDIPFPDNLGGTPPDRYSGVD
jgi:hypothetical protein